MVKKLAQIFGVVLLLAGVLGFVPGVTNDDGMLLGIFEVNAINNILHIAAGAIALWAAMTSLKATKMYFQVFGVIYAVVAVMGFFNMDGPVLGMAHNSADLALHVVIAVVALYAGFGMKAADRPAMSNAPMA